MKNDDTGESAYFDFYAQDGYTVIGEVNQNRINAHASLTIETNADQEQAILSGIKKMKEGPPNYDVMPDSDGIAECTNMSMNILKQGNVEVPFIRKFVPSDAWEVLFRKHASESLVTNRHDRGDRGGWRITKELPKIAAGQSYGRDPRGQSRRVDPNATDNRRLNFSDGRRVN